MTDRAVFPIDAEPGIRVFGCRGREPIAVELTSTEILIAAIDDGRFDDTSALCLPR